jgi:hypothetical protein
MYISYIFPLLVHCVQKNLATLVYILQVDELTLAFEESLQRTLTNQSDYPNGLKSFANVQRR